MDSINFDIEKLTKKEKEGYMAMTDAQKLSYAKKWIKLKEQEAELDKKMTQAQHRAKVKAKAEKEEQRKKDTHRKIINGGLLEAFLKARGAEFLIELDSPNENQKLERFLEYVFDTKYVKEKIVQLASEE